MKWEKELGLVAIRLISIHEYDAGSRITGQQKFLTIY